MKKKITQEMMVDCATSLADKFGLQAITIKNIAIELGIKPPSLYNHVKNLDALLDLAAYASMKNLYDHLLMASVGLEKKEALWSIANTYREFVKKYPGQYELAQKVALWKQEETIQISQQIVDLIARILYKYRLTEENAIHFIRTLRSYLHGFTLLEVSNAFGLDEDIEASFKKGVTVILNDLDA